MNFTKIFGGFRIDTRNDERIISLIHRHWWVLARKVAGVAVLLVAPLIVVPVVGIYLPATVPAAEIGATLGFLGSSWLLICWHLLFVRWTDYYLDIWVITNWRIVDIHMHGLYRIEVSTLVDLDHIQDVTVRTKGIVANILNFGDIELQTAGAKVEFLIREAPNPREIEREIRTGQEELMRIKASIQSAAQYRP